MLETEDLKKVYKTKKGVKVEALKGVSVKFPDKGMVFLLGKSGSGKSTLLNLLGGLDQYNDGEIVIQGVSSKDFNQGQFDSYRNTYVGFIFQEYNVLDEFSVGANVALAIELQGRKATDEEINAILQQVGLDGFGTRKPNELSGGQKQRVAIARALVKNPKIIMADEPTGALDSLTGRQVLETLKTLSKDKLVIVVSHDREFAENYADRIIELADGQIISDVERTSDTEESSSKEGIVFYENEIVFSEGYHLTEEDRKRINEYLERHNRAVKGTLKIHKDSRFRETDQSKIIHSSGKIELIKSKLAIKNAFKIGASGLKHKKIRLIITILLSFVSFSLFALADTFGSYDNVTTCTDSLQDSKVGYASFVKQVGHLGFDHKEDIFIGSARVCEEDLTELNKKTGLQFTGVYVPNRGLNIANYDQTVSLSENEDEEVIFHARKYSGFMEISQEIINRFGYSLVAGTLPQKDTNQAVISVYLFETFKKAGYKQNQKSQVIPVNEFDDLIGKTLQIAGKDYEVSGIIDTHMDMARYRKLDQDQKNISTTDKVAIYALSGELDMIQRNSLSCAVMLGQGCVQNMLKNRVKSVVTDQFDMHISRNDYEIYPSGVTTFQEIDASKVTWVNEEKTSLEKNEIIISSDCLENHDGDPVSYAEQIKSLRKHQNFKYIYSRIMSAEHEEKQKVKIVGVIDAKKVGEGYSGLLVLPNQLYHSEWKYYEGDYGYVVAPMPADKSKVKKLVQFNERASKVSDKEKIRYQMQNAVVCELSMLHTSFKVLSKVFWYIGFAFAIFSGIMLANFIATSIAYKKQEIGILRAIGARSSDVFKIFFTESLIIAIINCILACIGSGALTSVINSAIRMQVGALVTVLSFGIRQVILLLGLSIFVAFVASFLPVYRIAKKKPVDAIRNK